MTDQLFTGPHSTWEAEAKALRLKLAEAESRASWANMTKNRAAEETKALRARVATLEEALKRLIDTAEQCDLPEWAGFHLDQARAALQQESGENDAITEVYRLRIAMAHALARLDASLFTNAEHQQAKDTLRAALEAKP